MKNPSIKTRLLALLVRAARIEFARPLVILIFNHMDKLLPVDLICENEHWKAFHHPMPEYPLHILILPKQGRPTLLDATNDPDVFYSALFQLVRKLIIDHDLENKGYRLITNGGPNQGIPQWHWHLINENDDK